MLNKIQAVQTGFWGLAMCIIALAADTFIADATSFLITIIVIAFCIIMLCLNLFIYDNLKESK